jgi:CheY-like chemotaxis protein
MSPDGAPSHIICVDDDDDILQIASLALEKIGHMRATTFRGARAALDGLAQERPDLLLMDVMMPEMDGPTALRALRAEEELKDLPVIFMTARVQPSDVTHYLTLGAIGVIGKPFDPMTLADDVRRIWWKSREIAHAGCRPARIATLIKIDRV